VHYVYSYIPENISLDQQGDDKNFLATIHLQMEVELIQKSNQISKEICTSEKYVHTKTRSPLDEQHIWLSENDFNFGGE